MPSKRKQFNIRLSDEGWEVLGRLVQETGLTQPVVVERALRLMARKEGLPVPKKIPRKAHNST